MTDSWLVEALQDIRRVAALPNEEAYPALEAYLDRWQQEPEDGPTMGDLLGDPDWERRELQKDLIRLRAATEKEITGGRKILTWHINFLATEAARLQRDYPTAAGELAAEITAVTLLVARKVIALQAQQDALPQRRAGARGRTR